MTILNGNSLLNCESLPTKQNNEEQDKSLVEGFNRIPLLFRTIEFCLELYFSSLRRIYKSILLFLIDILTDH